MTLTTTWTTPSEIGATQTMSAQLFNENLMQNMLYLLNRPSSVYLSDADAVWNTSSTTPVAIDSGVMRQELDCVSGDVEVWGNLNLKIGGATKIAYIGIQIDDDYMQGDIPAGGNNYYIWEREAGVNNEFVTVNFNTKIYNLSVGIHSFAPFIWVSSGNVDWNGDLMNEFGVREI